MKRVAGLVAVVAAWHILSIFANSPMLVGVDRIALAWWGLVRNGVMLTDISISLQRVSAGFCVAAVIGVGIGIGMHRWPWMKAAVMPVVDAFRPVAALTLFPIIILTLGIGEVSKIFIICWTAWPACLLNTYQGLQDVDRSVIEAARLDGASEAQLIAYVSIPLAMQVIITGLRIGLSGGWISLVAAEMLGANSGLGFAVMLYSNSFQFAEMYAVIFTIALIGLGMNLLMARLQLILSFDGGSHEFRQSSFLRFGDRSSGWAIDSLFSRQHTRSRSDSDDGTVTGGAVR